MIVQTNLKLQITVNWIINKSKESISWLTSTCCIISIFSICLLRVSSQHTVFILPDGAAERVRAVPLRRSQCPPVTGLHLLVWHRDQSEHAAIQVHDEHHMRALLEICCQWFWQANISTADTDRWWRGWLTIASRLFHIDFALSCAESQSMPLYLDVDTSSFYTELSLAQVGLLRMKDLISLS